MVETESQKEGKYNVEENQAGTTRKGKNPIEKEKANYNCDTIYDF